MVFQSSTFGVDFFSVQTLSFVPVKFSTKFSGLNRVYDFVRVCPTLGNRVINLSVQRLAYTQNEILVVHRWVQRTANSRGFCKSWIPLSDLVYTITKGLTPRQTPQFEIRQ